MPTGARSWRSSLLGGVTFLGPLFQGLLSEGRGAGAGQRPRLTEECGTPISITAPSRRAGRGPLLRGVKA